MHRARAERWGASQPTLPTPAGRPALGTATPSPPVDWPMRGGGSLEVNVRGEQTKSRWEVLTPIPPILPPPPRNNMAPRPPIPGPEKMKSGRLPRRPSTIQGSKSLGPGRGGWILGLQPPNWGSEATEGRRLPPTPVGCVVTRSFQNQPSSGSPSGQRESGQERAGEVFLLNSLQRGRDVRPGGAPHRQFRGKNGIISTEAILRDERTPPRNAGKPTFTPR